MRLVRTRRVSLRLVGFLSLQTVRVGAIGIVWLLAPCLVNTFIHSEISDKRILASVLAFFKFISMRAVEIAGASLNA